MRATNTYLMKVPEREMRKNQEAAIFKEIMFENFPELKKDPRLKKLFPGKISCIICIVHPTENN